jgi:acyl-coenzyme A thioesterase PaaI-like protein
VSDESGEKQDWGARLDAVRGELAALAEGVRHLIDATVSVDAPPDVLRRAAAAVQRVAADLRRHVPEPKPPRYPGGAASDEVADFFPYDPVVGPLSPLAPPLRVSHADGRAVATVAFGTPYEGPPGCVHGGVLAACFDQVFNVANLARGVAGPTRRLEVRYSKPTPLGVELRFEGWVSSVEGREVRTEGRILAGDVVTAEAEGAFVQVSYERVMRLLDGDAASGSAPSAAPPEPPPAPRAGSGRNAGAARRRRARATGDGT